MTTCTACSNTTARRLCDTCTTNLRERLHALATMWADAPVTVRRQDRMTRSVVRSGEEGSPLPMNPDAAAVMTVIEVELRRWHFVLCHAAEQPRSVGAIVSDLYDAVDYISYRKASGQLLRWVRGAVDELAAAVDLPPERQWVGQCERCGRDLWALVDDDTVRCVCIGAQPVLVAQRHRELVSKMRDRLATAREAAFLLSSYGERVGESTIHAWAKKDLLVSHGTGPNGALYSLGDVLDLIDSAEQRRRKKDDARAAK